MPRIRPLAASLLDDLAIGREPPQRDHWRLWTIAVIATLVLWLDRGRSRRALAMLDEHQLRDIGVTRVDAERESAKPFWQP